MIVQTGKDQAIEITSSPAEMVQEIFQIREENQALIEDNERLLAELNYQMKCSSEPDMHSYVNCIIKHNDLMDKIR